MARAPWGDRRTKPGAGTRAGRADMLVEALDRRRARAVVHLVATESERG
ncbi:hypothetical protein HMPREF1550_01153 [Actinomyces sp. oral taxon 877 str. F0543]|nr:hypothetical protein HMPREF1550_01153 [Actinomyces sp. oral taxon 877 str. F0543]